MFVLRSWGLGLKFKYLEILGSTVDIEVNLGRISNVRLKKRRKRSFKFDWTAKKKGIEKDKTEVSQNFN